MAFRETLDITVHGRYTYYLHAVHQRPLCGKSGRYGPDCYIVVQAVPVSQFPLTTLDKAKARNLGIIIREFGEGYSKHRGPKSRFGKAVLDAQRWIAEQIAQTKE